MFTSFNFHTAGIPFPAQPVSLAEVPGLERLREVCEKFDVEITAFGSVVRRLAFHVLRRKGEPLPDLFTLAPFLSDIDLCHSGKPDQTPTIHEAILKCVPWSECFRWEISGETDLKVFYDDAVHLPLLPLRELRLPTRASTGIEDRHGAEEDIRSGQFRLVESAFYDRSNLKRQHRDCELLHAIFFLELLLEHDEGGSPEKHPGWEVCKALIRRSHESVTRVALGESAYLRTRLGYRFKALAAVCKSEKQWKDYIMASGLVDKQVPYLPRWILEERIRPQWWNLLYSCHLGGGLQRLPDRAPVAQYETDGQRVWNDLERNHEMVTAFSMHPLPHLAEDQTVVAASPRLVFFQGEAASGRYDEQVHVEFALKTEESELCKKFKAENLGVLAVLSGEDDKAEGLPKSYVVPLPSVCSFREFWRDDGSTPLLQTRVNFGRLLNVFPRLLRQAGYRQIQSHSLQLFIVADHE